MFSRGYRGSFAVGVILLALACGGRDEAPVPPPPPPAAAEAPATVASASGISGVVKHANGDPDAPIDMEADPVCQDLHSGEVLTQTVVADEEGHLANVFVYVKEGLSGRYPPPPEPALLDQQGCLFRPHVLGIQTGQTLIIRNSDPTLHSVHARPVKNPELYEEQPFEDMEAETIFETAEVMIPFTSDVHPWMVSYVAVLAHPFFAVSGPDGAFSIQDLPSGDYVLEAWHEVFGTLTQAVSLGEGEIVAVELCYTGAG